MNELPEPLPSLVAAHGLPAGGRARRAASGLIQTTWLCEWPDGHKLVAQRHHPAFDPGDGRGEALLHDIDAVTRHLDAHGLPTPRVRPRPDGELGWRDQEGRLWRFLTWLPGETINRVDSPALAEAAAELVARFHAAGASLDHRFGFTRPLAHDTDAHLARLAAARDASDDDVIRRLADEILGEPRPALPAAPLRLTHGDLKISNVLFEGKRAHALIDLDTLGRLTLAYELGDALRSWCNPLGEDTESPRFDLEVFHAAVRGYARGGFALTEAERASFVLGTQTVALELASRFCTDAFEDRYFGWDANRFPSRREHNRVRAAGQLALARAVAAVRTQAETRVAGVFAGPQK